MLDSVDYVLYCDQVPLNEYEFATKKVKNIQSQVRYYAVIISFGESWMVYRPGTAPAQTTLSPS